MTIRPFALASAAGLLLAGSALAQDAPKSLALGAHAPLAQVKMKSVDGSDVTIAGIAGKHGTLVVFTCNHCPWAQAWQARVAAIGNAATGMGIGVVAINPNDPAAYPEDAYAPMQERAKNLGLEFPYAVDATSEIARAFGATRTPEAFLFDSRGRLVYHGTVDDNARDESAVKFAWLKDAVSAVAAGKPVPVAETKAFGCSIKFREHKTS
jgi:peroxiredoxin